jgi:hypothetical protein
MASRIKINIRVDDLNVGSFSCSFNDLIVSVGGILELGCSSVTNLEDPPESWEVSACVHVQKLR